jgi:hypothetical protein
VTEGEAEPSQAANDHDDEMNKLRGELEAIQKQKEREKLLKEIEEAKQAQT